MFHTPSEVRSQYIRLERTQLGKVENVMYLGVTTYLLIIFLSVNISGLKRYDTMTK